MAKLDLSELMKQAKKKSAEAQAERRAQLDTDHYTARGHLGAPKKGKGYRPSTDEAKAILDSAMLHYEEPEIMWLQQASAEGNEEFEVSGFSYHDLPDLLSIPYWRPVGKSGKMREKQFALSQRLDIADNALAGVHAIRNEGCPRWLAEAMIADSYDQEVNRIVNVPKQDAIDWIGVVHSQLPRLNTKGLMYAIGLVRDGKLHVVATAGTVTGRWGKISPHSVLELTRIASDRAIRGGSSMLASRIIDLLEDSSRDRSQPALFVTYSLDSEQGSTYRGLRGKGLRPTSLNAPKEGTQGRRGADSVDEAAGGAWKLRWEAGPGAQSAKWDLLRFVGRDLPKTYKVVEKVVASFPPDKKPKLMFRRDQPLPGDVQLMVDAGLLGTDPKGSRSTKTHRAVTLRDSARAWLRDHDPATEEQRQEAVRLSRLPKLTPQMIFAAIYGASNVLDYNLAGLHVYHVRDTIRAIATLKMMEIGGGEVIRDVDTAMLVLEATLETMDRETPVPAFVRKGSMMDLCRDRRRYFRDSLVRAMRPKPRINPWL